MLMSVHPLEAWDAGHRNSEVAHEKEERNVQCLELHMGPKEEAPDKMIGQNWVGEIVSHARSLNWDWKKKTGAMKKDDDDRSWGQKGIEMPCWALASFLEGMFAPD